MSINLATLAKSINNTIEYIYPKTVSSIVEYTSEQTVEEKLQELDSRLGGVGDQISTDYYNKTEVDNLIYTPLTLAAYINIGSSASGSSTNCAAENGSSNTVTVRWVCSRQVGAAIPSGVTIDSAAQTVSGSSGTATFSNVSANHTYTVVSTDQKSATKTASCSISFINRVYWGVAADPGASNINSNFLLTTIQANNAGGSELRTNKNKEFSLTISGATTYGWYAVPASFVTANNPMTLGVKNSPPGGWILHKTFDFTNASGYTTSYNVYRTTNANLGTNTFVAS